jgi:heme/copper-type cytochrome/quinol oxidase subunit 1
LFGVLSMFVAIFSAIKVLTWTATLRRGSIFLRDADAVLLLVPVLCSSSAA